MIPTERNDTMLVTLTAGDLAKLVGDVVENRLQHAVQQLTEVVQDAQSKKRQADIIEGTRAIAEAVGCSPNTLYREMKNNPRLASSIKHIGNKRIANRDELMAALRS